VSNATNVITKLTKSKNEQVHISLGEFGGCVTIDVRIWAAWDGVSFRPTQKGVTLRVERLPALLRALDAAQLEAERRGLIGVAA
jgi:hypothetical protein